MLGEGEVVVREVCVEKYDQKENLYLSHIFL